MSLVPLSPVGRIDAVPFAFAWSGATGGWPSTVVVHGPDYAEFARFDGIVGSALPVPHAVAEALEHFGELHWRVECAEPGRHLHSPLQTFSIR